MDLEEYGIDELMLWAMKAEVNAEEVYRTLAGRVKNAILQDRFKFLAGEEVSHRKYIEDTFRELFPGRDGALPLNSPVPLPEIEITENSQISDVIRQAMDAEMASRDFYRGMSEKFEQPLIKETLLYFASMEEIHHKILDEELKTAEKFEDYDVEWGMMHAGP